MTVLVSRNLTTIPVVLRAVATLSTAGAGPGVPVSFDSTKIQNTSRVPIEVTSLLITTFGRRTLAGVAQTPCVGDAGIDVDLAVHRARMTDEFVPLTVLGPWSGADLVFNMGGEDANNFIDRITRHVLLPQPIRLLPGVGFSGRVRRNPPAVVTGTFVGAKSVAITAIGRSVPGGIFRPSAQRIPYWSAARLDLAVNAAGSAGETIETELRNGLSSTLDVERIIYASASVGATYQTPRNDLTSRALDPAVQIRWPNGDLLNETDVRAQSLFLRSSSFFHPFALPPNSRARARVSVTTNTDDAKRVDLALFGTRMEVL